MKLAVLLFGLSKFKYRHWYRVKRKRKKDNVIVNYLNSFNNYQEYIYKYFKNKGFDIDTYFVTNELNKEDKEEIIRKFEPISYEFIKNQNTGNFNNDRFFNRNNRFKKVLELCLNAKKKYDNVLITRFDLIFNKEIINLDLNKFNIISLTGKIDDNFYFFDFKFLKKLHLIAKYHRNRSYHHLYNAFKNNFGEENIHFINEKFGRVIYTIFREYSS